MIHCLTNWEAVQQLKAHRLCSPIFPSPLVHVNTSFFNNPCSGHGRGVQGRGVDPDGTSYWRTSLTPGGLLWLCHERLRVCQSCGPAERVWGPDGPQRARVAGPTDAEASTTRPPSRTPAAVLRTDGATGQMTDLHLGVH
ncbi:unnamed protein product [Gadus morhua 'NCC']